MHIYGVYSANRATCESPALALLGTCVAVMERWGRGGGGGTDRCEAESESAVSAAVVSSSSSSSRSSSVSRASRRCTTWYAALACSLNTDGLTTLSRAVLRPKPPLPFSFKTIDSYFSLPKHIADFNIGETKLSLPPLHSTLSIPSRPSSRFLFPLPHLRIFSIFLSAFLLENFLQT